MISDELGAYYASQSEKDFMQSVRDQAKALGWRCYHSYDSRKSDEGFPDLVCVHEGMGRQFVAELKTEDGQPTAEQEAWLRAFGAAGTPNFVWRPSDGAFIAQILMGGAP